MRCPECDHESETHSVKESAREKLGFSCNEPFCHCNLLVSDIQEALKKQKQVGFLPTETESAPQEGKRGRKPKTQ
jgi:hypothetical protein